MKKWVFSLIILAMCVAQLSFLDKFKIFNVAPDLLLICVVLASLTYELRWALFFSVFCGILKDSLGPNTVSVNTLIFPVWCLLIMKLTREISIDNNYMRTALVFIVALVHGIVSGLAFVYLGRVISAGIFLRTVCIGSFYTAVTLPLVLKIIKPVYNNRDF